MRDLGPKGITVNTVYHGQTDTDMNADGGPVSKIASVVAYRVSPETAFVTGADIVADGGFTA